MLKIENHVLNLWEKPIILPSVTKEMPEEMGRNCDCQLGEYQSGQLGRTVNPLTYVFTGSNPVSPTP